METRVGDFSFVGHAAEDSMSFGSNTSFVAEEELLSAIGGLRVCVDPFLLSSWVREEAYSLGQNARLPELFNQSAECSPRILLCVLGYAYTIETFSSEEIVRNCRSNGALGALSGGKFLLRQELRRFRRRHRALLTDLITRVFMRFVSEWFGLNRWELPLRLKRNLQRAAIDRLDIARHLDASDE